MESVQSAGNWSSTLEVLLNQSFPVHRACRDGDVEQLTALLADGSPDLYEEDDFYGWTPMHWAAYFGKLQCLIRLLESGVCSDAPTERLNQTPAHIAAYGGHSHCLKWLLHSGAMINTQLNCLKKLINTQAVAGGNCDMPSSKYSQTPTHLCAYAGHPQCLYWLLNCRANLDLQDYMGETPMHKAARTGTMECVSLLVSSGAKLSMKNYSGNTASQVAAAAGLTECASYLERAMQSKALTGDTGTPGTQPPASNPFTPVTNPLNTCRLSPEGQPGNTPSHYISTDTYHSNPHISNGCSRGDQILPNMNNNNNSCSEDCDMEMDEGAFCRDSMVLGAPNGDATGMNGLSAMAMRPVANGDVLLHEGVQRNYLPLAGKKRGLEDTETECFKRARNDDSHPDKRKLNGWYLNNSHMTGHVTDHMTQTSDSMVEHRTSVTMQQGFDSHMTGQVTDHMTQTSDSMVEHHTSVTMQQGYDSMILDCLVHDT